MIKIHGHYHADFKLVEYNAEIPADWSELDGPQFATIMELLSLDNDKYMKGASLLSVLFGPKNWHILNNLGDEDLHELMKLTNFLFETPPTGKNHYPKLKARKREYHAPADDLGNLCFGEWCFLYNFFDLYRSTRSDELIDRIVATLYRPADTNMVPGTANFSGDIREKFNENLIGDRARSFRDIQSHLKKAVIGWLQVAMSNIMEARPNAFPVKKDDEESSAESSGSADWFAIFRELLGPKWGTIEQLKYTNALFVLDHLEEQQIAFQRSQRTE